MHKDDLVELATALELSLTDGSGKPLAARILVVNIKEHFEARGVRSTDRGHSSHSIRLLKAATRIAR